MVQLNKLKPISGLNSKALPDICRDGDLAFARQSGCRHGAAPQILIPYFTVRGCMGQEL